MAWCRENINLPNVHFVGRFGTISQLIWWLLALNKKLRFQNLKVPFQLLSCVGPSCALPLWSFRHWLRHLWPLGNNENENVFRFINYWLLMPVKHWLTTVSLVNLTDMTLAVEDANSNLLMLSLLPMLTLERVLTIRWWQLIACLYIVSVVTLSGALNIGFVVPSAMFKCDPFSWRSSLPPCGRRIPLTSQEEILLKALLSIQNDLPRRKSFSSRKIVQFWHHFHFFMWVWHRRWICQIFHTGKIRNFFNFTRSEKPINRDSFGQKFKWRIFHSSTLNKLSVFVQFPTQIQTPSSWFVKTLAWIQ